jgi:hypothetical protein
MNLRHCVVDLLRELTLLDICNEAVYSTRGSIEIRGCRLYVRHSLSDLGCHLLIPEKHSGRSAALFETYQQIIGVTYGSVHAVKRNVQLSSNLL